jgi:hypothetical protein
MPLQYPTLMMQTTAHCSYPILNAQHLLLPITDLAQEWVLEMVERHEGDAEMAWLS